MSRLSSRVSSTAAVLAIVLLVVFLVILWTGINTAGSMKNGEKRESNRTVPASHQQQRDFKDNLRVIDVRSGSASVVSEELTEVNDVTPDITRSQQEVLAQNREGNIEYVKPLKLSHSHYEDPVADGNATSRHDTGHFRHSSTDVWDPHPQYEFTAFGKLFRLRLTHDNGFISQSAMVMHKSGNKTKLEPLGYQMGCYYNGVVDGDPKSIVSVSLCQGMTGHVKTSTGSYIIKPTEKWKTAAEQGSPLQHAIYKLSSTKTNSNEVNSPDESGHNCGVIDYDPAEEAPAPLIDDNSRERLYVGDHRRERRALVEKHFLDRSIEEASEEEFEEFIGHYGRSANPTQLAWKQQRIGERVVNDRIEDEFNSWRSRRALPREYFIEIMVVADAKMVEYHGPDLHEYVLVLMNTVSRIYKDPSIGNPITIAVTKIVKTDDVFGTKHNESDGIAASEMLRSFCRWQKDNNPDEPSPEHHDTALLLTRENLCHNPHQKRCDTLGLAELGRMCSPGSSCAIVQDNGLAAAFTIAHEIGHVFSMPHDDDSKCTKFRNRSGVHNVMSRMLDDNTFPWEWSKCSRHYVTEFLEAGHANCLLDEPNGLISPMINRQPGEVYSPDQQCELVFGTGSKLCPHMENDVCERLWCVVAPWGYRSPCHTQHTPWANGTPCGEGKWCINSKCVWKRNLQPIDGQWGEWGPYGPCSRSCGGGIKIKERKCNNPSPQHGGNYCIGERVRHRSCGTKECPPGTPDFREEQCSHFNGDNRNIKGLMNNVEWHAKYVQSPPDQRCMLYCQVDSKQHYKLANKVIDGTPCGLDTFDICVNGQCRPAGCDHVLNSTAQLDICGVCRGNNSTCQRIAGSYNESGFYGYRNVAKIPAGSSYIDIRLTAWGGIHNDKNYLALRIASDGRYILNGNFTVMRQKIKFLPGLAIEYSGASAQVERLNSSRPIPVDLILEVLNNDENVPPQIEYEYTVPKKILGSYTWILSDWSTCSYVCQGTKQRRAECRSTEHKDVVSDDYCRPEERPQEQTQICNSHCSLQWQEISRSECSNHCGPGIQTVITRCVQILMKSTNRAAPRPLPPYACSHLERPKEHMPCTGPCDDAHWSYSEWDKCSVSCGGGIQMRTANCVDASGRIVSDDKCNSSQKILVRVCGQDTCPQWAFDDWSPCSEKCGIGIRKRPYWCQVQNHVINPVYCRDPLPPIEESCYAGPCHYWSAGEWSTCPVTCGEGTRRRKVACLSADGSSSDACAISEKPDDVEICKVDPCPTIASVPPIIYSSDLFNTDPSQDENEIDSNGITFHPGYEWRTGNFGECTKPCNGGLKHRIVQCTSKETHSPAPDDYYCDVNQRPASTMPCNRHACPFWNTGDWSECNVECGDGYQHRQVRCQSQRGEIQPDKECNINERPKHAKKCRKAACVIQRNHNSNSRSNPARRWRVSNWTPCSKSCGGGIKTRKVECVMKTEGNEEPVEDEQCSRLGLARPRSQRPCQRLPCDFTWREGGWSECSVDCGEGIQRRAVTCHKVNRYGWVDPSPTDGCTLNEKPKGEQTCKLQGCNDKYYWSTGPWRKCSHQCGRKGREIRRLFCHDRSGKRVAKFNCPLEYKPQRKRKCNQRRCGPLTCLEAKKKLKSNNDGEYTLLIGGKNMSIYCHDMSTREPKEYLTLPAGDRENYAEIYDKRLRDPRICPYNGQRNDSCECVSEPGTISGRTMFKRVRIDVAKLIIIANDYTFSRTKGGKRIEYGKAGDCYSLADCPQGRFSINLSGTSLSLTPGIKWLPQKSRAHVNVYKINDQRIQGKCGGYCGFCSPNMDLKLDVLHS